jgi:opacity protein-like surface antigen
MKKRVCTIMGAVCLFALAQTADAKVKKAILTEPNWVSTSNSQSVLATSTANSQFMLANPATSNSPATGNSPDGFTSTESHHGGGGGSGMEGKNMVDLGVGFGGGLSGYSYGAGYTNSGGIGFFAKFEHMLTGNIGLGLSVSYASLTETATGTDYYNTPPYAQFSYTFGWKYTALGIMVRGAYHFTVNDNFDPYVGLGLGYFSFSATSFDNDPNNASSNGVTLVAPSLGGLGYTVFAGARYYFASSIGAFLELGFDGYAGNLVKVGLALKF